MQIPIQVSFRHLGYSPSVDSAVQKRAQALSKFFPRITSLRVIIEPSQLRRQQGNLYHVRIDMTVPGREIVVRRDPGKHHAHEDIYVAIRDAFDAARRQLEDYVRANFRDRRRHGISSSRARIIRLFPNEGCGFLVTQDGREIYFHKNSVPNRGFEKLHSGDPVRFVEKIGIKGPQASTVKRA
jgi:cold shock CspA family protein/ribosome-associated translation inhibitor RaiA